MDGFESRPMFPDLGGGNGGRGGCRGEGDGDVLVGEEEGVHQMSGEANHFDQHLPLGFQIPVPWSRFENFWLGALKKANFTKYYASCILNPTPFYKL